MPEVTRHKLGAWLLKCNPEIWNIERFRADGHRMVHSWVVQDNYRSALMTKGDPVVLWVTGDGKHAGVLGVGQVTGQVGQRTAGYDYEESYWSQSQGPRTKALLWVPTEIGLVPTSLSRHVVRAEPALRAAEVFAAPQLGNPNFLDIAQWAVLQWMLLRNLVLGAP